MVKRLGLVPIIQISTLSVCSLKEIPSTFMVAINTSSLVAMTGAAETIKRATNKRRVCVHSVPAAYSVQLQKSYKKRFSNLFRKLLFKHFLSLSASCSGSCHKLLYCVWFRMGRCVGCMWCRCFCSYVFSPFGQAFYYPKGVHQPKFLYIKVAIAIEISFLIGSR